MQNKKKEKGKKKEKKKQKKQECMFVHVGGMVAEVMYQQRVPKPDFAGNIGTDLSNLYRILKKESLDTNQLYRYSKELKHNFFRELAEEFDKRFPLE